jgi:hypothetical protein
LPQNLKDDSKNTHWTFVRKPGLPDGTNIFVPKFSILYIIEGLGMIVLVNFMVLWNIFWLFGIFYIIYYVYTMVYFGIFGNYLAISYIFPTLVHCTKKNLATLAQTHEKLQKVFFSLSCKPWTCKKLNPKDDFF